MDVTMKALESAFQVANTRGNVIANNLANLDTPNFQASQVPFQLTMDQLLGTGQGGTPLVAEKTDYRHFSFSTGTDSNGLVQTLPGNGGNDGNNVSMDQQVTLLAQNDLNQQTLSAQLQNRYAQYHLVINGGGSLG